jgi:hypothetical protein
MKRHNRLVVNIDLAGRRDCWAKHDSKTVRFANLNEAREYAERQNYSGVHFVVARGYGLKPRLVALLGG